MNWKTMLSYISPERNHQGKEESAAVPSQRPVTSVRAQRTLP